MVMRFEAVVNINAAIDVVWGCLLDARIVEKCIAGGGISIGISSASEGILAQVGDEWLVEMPAFFANMPIHFQAKIQWQQMQSPHFANLKVIVAGKRDRQNMGEKTPKLPKRVAVENELRLESVGAREMKLLWIGVLNAGNLGAIPPQLIRAFVAAQSRAFFVCLKNEAETINNHPSP